MRAKGMTLSRHILGWQQRYPHAVGELSILLEQVAFAAKVLSREMRRAALAGTLGLVGEKNATGDAQKKLDVLGNDIVVEAFAESGLVAAIVSEELDEAKHIAGGSDATYVLCVDPLDGSSNTDINALVGTIFGIYRRVTTGAHETVRDLLRRL
jgi:fructose-1,6-bisphosphatase I